MGHLLSGHIDALFKREKGEHILLSLGINYLNWHERFAVIQPALGIASGQNQVS